MFHAQPQNTIAAPALCRSLSQMTNLFSCIHANIKLFFQEPCQRELYKVLERLAAAQQKAGDEIYKFYLPNCNKNGFYHSKQVSGLATVWSQMLALLFHIPVRASKYTMWVTFLREAHHCAVGRSQTLDRGSVMGEEHFSQQGGLPLFRSTA